VFFRKGWLEQTMRVFESFERAGMVSAQPVFFDFLKGEARTAREIGQSGGQLEVISVQPRAEILEEYCDGINASPEMRQQFRSQLLQTAINHQTGMRAVTSATDMQFMLRKEVAARMIPMPIAGALTGKDAIEIPRGVEAQGYWILSTEEPLVWHIGNSISDRPYPEIERLMSGKEVSGQRAVDSSQWAVGSRQEAVDSSQCVVSSGQTASGGLKSRFKASMQRGVRRSPVVKRWMERLYAGLFSLLYEEIRFPHP
jgi:hypothetical protein